VIRITFAGRPIGKDDASHATTEDPMSITTSVPGPRFPRICWGCGERFPVRAGQAEALLGKDGRLYCHDGRPECLERAFGVDGKAA